MHRGLVGVALAILFLSTAAGAQPASPAVFGDAFVAPDLGASGLTASSFLAGLSADRRAGAVIQLEIARGLDAATLERARSSEMAWAAGRYADAITAVRALESDGVHVDVAVSYGNPRTVEGPTLGSNVQIAANVGGEPVTDTALDIDLHTGNLLAIGRAAGTFSVFLSPDGGLTWSETDNWCCDPGDVDLAAVAGWGYIVYDSPTDTEYRIRRVYGTTGVFDNVYFWYPVLNYGADAIWELVIVANAEVFDNRIYTAALVNDGSIAWHWADATTATTFNRQDPSILGNAGGLSMAYVSGWDNSGPYLFLSIRGTADSVWVLPKDGSWGAGTQLTTSAYPFTTTSVSSYLDTVLVSYAIDEGTGLTSTYRISYNEGATWSSGTLVSETEGGDFSNPQVSARSGTGTACLVQEEAGTFDNLVFKQRFNYAPGGWSAIQPLNDVDFTTFATSIDFEYLWTGWGVTYVDNSGAIWFTLSRAIFYSGFERGDNTDWSAHVP